MSDTGQLIAAHAQRLKRILEKHRAGKRLTAAELAIIGADESAGAATLPGAAAGGPTSYDSLQAAAAAMGIPKEDLQAAKESGAPGFRGSRVYPAELVPWLNAQRTAAKDGKPGAGPILGKRALECRLLEARLAALEWDMEQSRGRYILREEVDGWMLEKSEQVKAILRARLKNELPPKLEGLRAPEIAAKMDSVISDIVKEMRLPVSSASGPSSLPAASDDSS